MPRTKRQGGKKAAAVDQDGDAFVSTSTPPPAAAIESDSRELHLRDMLKTIEDVESKWRQRLADELEAMDRALAITLAQMSEEDLNRPPASVSAAKESLSADFASFKKIVSSTTYKPGPASSKQVASEEIAKEPKKTAAGRRAAAASAAASASKTAPVKSKPLATKAVTAKQPAGSRTVPAKKVPVKVPVKDPVKATVKMASAAAASTHESRPRGRPSRATRQSAMRDTTPCSSEIAYADETCIRRPRTRSVSRSSSASASTSVFYQTPRSDAHRTLMHSLSVTPKVDPYGPISLKRQPRHGEMALSMSGSPLMVNVNTQEPNIAVPINDEVYCIMATDGPVPDIGGIDEATKAKLKTLRANLNQILGDC